MKVDVPILTGWVLSYKGSYDSVVLCIILLWITRRLQGGLIGMLYIEVGGRPYSQVMISSIVDDKMEILSSPS